jgi:thiosulfate/3-mercaptopyruvate sulfurtransferase
MTPDDDLHDERLLVGGDWLQGRLDDPRVRVIDCTVWMTPQPVGPSRLESGRPHYDAGHVPGAAFLSMSPDLAAPGGPTPYSLAPADAVAERLRAIGVDDDTTLVVYAASGPMVATRTWWALRASGACDVRVLDGGWQAWVAEGRPVSVETPVRAEGRFRGLPSPGLRAAREDVLRAMHEPGTQLLNALSPEQFRGTGGAHYGRPGRIPGSLNLPFASTWDPATGRFRPPSVLRRLAVEAGLDDASRVVHYCGGGIAASGTLFVLELLGHRNGTLYDHSLLEWSADPALPMVTGEPGAGQGAPIGIGR